MKSRFLSLVLSIMAFSLFASAQNEKLLITVSFERQEGRGSNQYAVWIEDDAGKLVRTLFVTRFTAQGGYDLRPGCTPLWVQKADAKNMDCEQVDVISGATPLTGEHTYEWDLTDHAGNKVKRGRYTFVVQGTYAYPDHQVLFKGSVDLDGAEAKTVETSAKFSSAEAQNKGMIKGVKANYLL